MVSLVDSVALALVLLQLLWFSLISIDIDILTAVGLSPDGSTHLHTNNT